MITVNNLTLSWGGFTLLNNINFHLNNGEKVGLVGKNGAGKTTLLRIINGEQTPTSGKITKTKGEKIGYLPQQMEHAKDKSVRDEALMAFNELFELHNREKEINKILSERDDYQSDSYNNLIVELNSIADKIHFMESEPPEAQVERVLKGLGFKESEFDRPTSTLSQGWNMRIELAKIILSNPDILLLDEPTNHLDIESIQWFENYLETFKGSVILISHDRRFLDNVTSRTLEIMLSKLYDYKVPYSKYKELRGQRMEQQKAAWENQQRMIEKTEEFIERFRYKATKSNQVQSRIKQLNKLEKIEIDLEDKSHLSVKFPPAPRSGNVVFKVENGVIGYPNKIVLNGLNITIQRGEKVAFLGRNGEGKTTLMKVITKELHPLEGKAEIGHNVEIGYYAQNQEDVLDKNDTVWSTLDKIATGDIRSKLRDILGAFLFKGEDIDKKVSVLSGGERARLAMAKLILFPYNFLVLDEPTNHMDILSKEILKQALKNYDGTLVIVSHDRDFLDSLVDKVYQFGDGVVKEYLGGISDYLYHLQVVSKEQGRSESKKENRNSSRGDNKNLQNQEHQNQNQQQLQNKETNRADLTDSQRIREESKLARKKRKEIEKIEKEIVELDFELSKVEVSLTQATEPQKIEELSKKYSEIKSDRDAKMDLWLTLSS